MKKLFKVLFVAILAIAVAAPAMADVSLNGYFRTQMQADNVDGRATKDAQSSAAVDQRIRMKVTNQLNDDVKVVYYGEVDTVWGKASKAGSVTLDETVAGIDFNNDGDTLDTAVSGADAGIGVNAVGGGGKVGADGVNVETKNAYVQFNVPNTPLSASVGVQGFGLGYEGIVIAQDAAGVKANMAVSDTVGLGFMYAKFDEGSFSAADDEDFYAAQAKFKLAEGAKLAAHLMFMNLNGSDEDVTGAGVRYDGMFGDVGFNAWGVYHDVEDITPGGGNTTGFGASAQAVFGPGAVRLTYFTGDDGGPGPDSDEFVYDIGNGAFGFYKENLQIMFYDIYYNNLGSTGVALENSAGLIAINGKYDMMMGDMYLKLGAGYFMTAEDVNVGGGATDDVLGAEISARLGKKIAEKVDVSLNCAYAMVGDALTASTVNDDVWKANFMINVPF